MENWYKGDIAICIKDGPLDQYNQNQIERIKKYPLTVRLNAEYIVHNIYKCPKCENFCLDIGMANHDSSVACCGENIPFKEIRWFAAERFKKKEVETKMSIPFLTD